MNASSRFILDAHEAISRMRQMRDQKPIDGNKFNENQEKKKQIEIEQLFVVCKIEYIKRS